MIRKMIAGEFIQKGERCCVGDDGRAYRVPATPIPTIQEYFKLEGVSFTVPDDVAEGEVIALADERASGE
jgi:hypothetical protein